MTSVNEDNISKQINPNLPQAPKDTCSSTIISNLPNNTTPLQNGNSSAASDPGKMNRILFVTGDSTVPTLPVVVLTSNQSVQVPRIIPIQRQADCNVLYAPNNKLMVPVTNTIASKTLQIVTPTLFPDGTRILCQNCGVLSK
uniref:Uncharacterized protein n=1 Tax=Ciona savignyi TaxID=51511 RepID=H2ZMB9_CIOSA